MVCWIFAQRTITDIKLVLLCTFFLLEQFYSKQCMYPKFTNIPWFQHNVVETGKEKFDNKYLLMFCELTLWITYFRQILFTSWLMQIFLNHVYIFRDYSPVVQANLTVLNVQQSDFGVTFTCWVSSDFDIDTPKFSVKLRQEGRGKRFDYT